MYTDLETGSGITAIVVMMSLIVFEILIGSFLDFSKS